MDVKNAPNLNSGVYVLWLDLPTPQKLTIGKLGTFIFEQGIYAYCGSAQRGLKQRIARHARQDKKCHWHIDYLRMYSRYLGAITILEQPKSGECWLVRELLKIPGSYLPVAGFGSSDCTCGSHLVRVSLAYPRPAGD